MVDPADISVPALLAAARRPEVFTAMRDFYAELDERVAANMPVCSNRGECCQFGRYGHRLYVTALEVVYYLVHTGGNAIPPVTQDACPHAHEGKCQARQHRALGCRVFYCDPRAGHWQGPLTEEMLSRLRRMHRELNVPYFYTEWLAVLRALARQGEPM